MRSEQLPAESTEEVSVLRSSSDPIRETAKGNSSYSLTRPVILPFHRDHVQPSPLLVPPANVAVEELKTLLGLLTQSTLQVLNENAERKSAHVGCYELGDSRSVYVVAYVPAAGIDLITAAGLAS